MTTVQVAYDCLMSVPVDVEGDIKEIEELKAFLQWQSTLAWLKSGVEGQFEPHDVMGLLDSFSSAVKEDNPSKSDWEVQMSISGILDGKNQGSHQLHDPADNYLPQPRETATCVMSQTSRISSCSYDAMGDLCPCLETEYRCQGSFWS